MVKQSEISIEIESVPKDERIAYRWGGDKGLFRGGFLSIPTRFLRGYALGRTPLTTAEAMFLLQLMTFKWGAKSPHPSYERLGRMMGVTARMASRYAKNLERKGYLERCSRKGRTNEFDLAPLFRRVESLPMTKAEEKVVQKWIEERSDPSGKFELDL